jgi:hypothetical protein
MRTEGQTERHDEAKALFVIFQTRLQMANSLLTVMCRMRPVLCLLIILVCLYHL